MPFDFYAPRTKLEAKQIREHDYLRIGDGGDDKDWRLVKQVSLAWPDVAVECEGNLTLSFPREATVEVSRRTEWVDVEDRYRIIDIFPYLERQEEFNDLTLGEAALKMEDLTGMDSDLILADFDEPDVNHLEWTDDETGREVSLVPEVEPEPDRGDPPVPEAGDMSRGDGLGA